MVQKKQPHFGLQVSFGRFFRDLKQKIQDDNISNGAAALAYYLMFSIFPAAIFFLTLLPYLPIPHLHDEILRLLGQFMPTQVANLFSGVVGEVTSQKRGGLLSLGFLLTLWGASRGMYAIMQQLNITYDVKEGRGFFKVRAVAIMLTILFGMLMTAGLALTIFGDSVGHWLQANMGMGPLFLVLFAAFRWVVIVVAMLLAFAVTYYWGPDVEREFKFITPGSALGVLLLFAVSLGFKMYIDHFSNYAATYGSLGTVIVHMLWLNIMGLVILVGSEVNALIEDYSLEGKRKGERSAPPVRKSA